MIAPRLVSGPNTVPCLARWLPGYIQGVLRARDPQLPDAIVRMGEEVVVWRLCRRFDDDNNPPSYDIDKLRHQVRVEVRDILRVLAYYADGKTLLVLQKLRQRKVP